MVMMEKGPTKKYVADAIVKAYEREGFTVVGGGAVTATEPEEKPEKRKRAGKKKEAKHATASVTIEADSVMDTE